MLTQENIRQKAIDYGLLNENEELNREIKDLDIQTSKAEVMSILGLSQCLCKTNSISSKELEKAVIYNVLIKNMYSPEQDIAVCRKMLIDYLHTLNFSFNVGW